MQSTPDPSHVRFTGPLSSHARSLVGELARLGYTTTSATSVMQLAAHLSRWLDSAGVALSEMTGGVLASFLAVRRAEYTSHYSMQSLGPILAYLRREGLIPPESAPVPSSPVEVVLAGFRSYLIDDRGLSHPVACAYAHWVTPFVRDVHGADDSAGIAGLTAEDVARFLTVRLPSMTRKSAQMTACALRSFLRYLHNENLVDVMLADAVPAVAHRRLSGLPLPLDQQQVDALLGVCDRATAVGRRDFAVITVLYRLGLRAGETAGLRLDEVDWRAGVITIRGKGGRTDRLPLPVDVGDAIVDYLRHGRPGTEARTVFVKTVAPHTALGYSGLSCIVARAARRAGLGTIHAHRLRHTMASHVLNAGASLEDVSHLLRHASLATTAIYAKTDLTRLATLERTWPTGGGVS